MSALDMVDAFAAYLTLTGRSEYTIREWRQLLRRVDRELPYGLDNADENELMQWLGQPGWSANTRSTYHAALFSFYRWATRPADRWLNLNPMEGVPRPRADRGVPKPCSSEELHAILAAAPEPYYTWAVLAAYGGLRCIEIARLDREHVDAHVLRLFGKGSKGREVPTHPLVWQTLQGLPPGPLVRYRAGRQAGQRVTGRYVSHMSCAYLHDQLEMRHMHLHRLRHWYATRALDACGDIRVVQELLGHSSVATTQVYTKVNSQRRRAAVAGLPWPGGR